MTRVTGTFRTLGWEEVPYDAAVGQPTLVHADATNELMGDIEGEASISYLMGYGPDRATFVGLARVTGKVGDREGSFVMQDVGTFENGVVSGRGTIVPGLGSGALRDVRGDGHFEAGPKEVSYTMDLSF
jgi:hypothetical protein